MSVRRSKGINRRNESRSGSCHFDGPQHASGRTLNDSVVIPSRKNQCQIGTGIDRGSRAAEISCRWSSFVASRRMHLRVTRRTAAGRGIHWIRGFRQPLVLLLHLLLPPFSFPPLSLSTLSPDKTRVRAYALIVAIIALSCNYVLGPMHPVQCTARCSASLAQTAPASSVHGPVREIETTRCYNGMLTSTTSSAARAPENVAHRRVGVFGTVQAAVVRRPIHQGNDLSAV